MTLVFILWVALSIVVGYAARARGRSLPGWILLALALSPLVAILILIAFPAADGGGAIRVGASGSAARGRAAGLVVLGALIAAAAIAAAIS